MTSIDTQVEWRGAAGEYVVFSPSSEGLQATYIDDQGVAHIAQQVLFVHKRPDDEQLQSYLDQSRIVWNEEDQVLQVQLRGLLGGGCLPSKCGETTTGVTWTNHLGNVQVTAKTARPASFAELEGVIVGKGKVKAAGSGHSYNPLCDTDGTLVLMDQLNRFASLDLPIAGQLTPDAVFEPHRLVLDRAPDWNAYPKGAERTALIEVEAGASVREVVEGADGLGLAVYNLGGANIQTISGAFSTGTHGSGATLGPLHTCVRSLVLVTDSPLFDSEPKQKSYVYRIEPSKGITDPKNYLWRGIRLVQNDEVFHTVNLSLGACGIIYSYVLEVLPAYDLAEERSVTTWGQIKKSLKPNRRNPQKLPSLLYENRHFEFVINPYSTDDGLTHKVATTVRNVWDKEHPDYGGPVESERNLLVQMTGCEMVNDVLADWMHHWKKQIPQLLDQSLEALATKEGKPYVDASWRVFNIGAHRDAGFAFEVFFPVTDEKGVYNPELLFDALDSALEAAARHAQDGRYQTAPMSVRFVKGDQALLSMTYSGDQNGALFAAIEFLMINSRDDAQDQQDLELLEDIEELMHALGARTHWGLDAVVNPQKLEHYDEAAVERWKAVQSKLNARGTFSNHVLERLGM